MDKLEQITKLINEWQDENREKRSIMYILAEENEEGTGVNGMSDIGGRLKHILPAFYDNRNKGFRKFEDALAIETLNRRASNMLDELKGIYERIKEDAEAEK